MAVRLILAVHSNAVTGDDKFDTYPVRQPLLHTDCVLSRDPMPIIFNTSSYSRKGLILYLNPGTLPSRAIQDTN